MEASYNGRPQRVRLAMVDKDGMPHSVVSQPMNSDARPAEDMPQGIPLDNNGIPQVDGNWSEDDGGPPGNCPTCGNGGNCGSCGGCGCRPLCCLFCRDWWEQTCPDLSISAGTQGFKGPIDQGLNGDFGFHEGINWGSPFWDAMGIGASDRLRGRS